jgi:hypothetical protein
MKTQLIKIMATCLVTCSAFISKAQTSKTSLTLLNIDSKTIGIEPKNMGNMVRLEIEKLNKYDVKDKYDVQYFLEQNKLDMVSCYGKTCLTEMGTLLKSDKMFTGSVERIGKIIVITYRILDVGTSSFEKTYVHEFLNISEEIQNMVKLSVAQMFDVPFDKNLMDKLSKPYEFANTNNNPEVARLRLDGPRMGFTTYSGQLRDRMMESKKSGGFDVFPVMFQFGYQFEKQYLNEGKIQALFEFIPMITGLDQGYFIPSATILHGVRSNISGWEFAFGPTFNVVPTANGYYDANGLWQKKNHWGEQPENTGIENPFEITERLDSRGDYQLKTAFVLAAGRTFKSGKLNIPVNVYVIPGKEGWRFGLSVGFNARNK